MKQTHRLGVAVLVALALLAFFDKLESISFHGLPPKGLLSTLTRAISPQMSAKTGVVH